MCCSVQSLSIREKSCAQKRLDRFLGVLEVWNGSQTSQTALLESRRLWLHSSVLKAKAHFYTRLRWMNKKRWPFRKIHFLVTQTVVAKKIGVWFQNRWISCGDCWNDEEKFRWSKFCPHKMSQLHQLPHSVYTVCFSAMNNLLLSAALFVLLVISLLSIVKHYRLWMAIFCWVNRVDSDKAWLR